MAKTTTTKRKAIQMEEDTCSLKSLVESFCHYYKNNNKEKALHYLIKACISEETPDLDYIDLCSIISRSCTKEDAALFHKASVINGLAFALPPSREESLDRDRVIMRQPDYHLMQSKCGSVCPVTLETKYYATKVISLGAELHLIHDTNGIRIDNSLLRHRVNENWYTMRSISVTQTSEQQNSDNNNNFLPLDSFMVRVISIDSETSNIINVETILIRARDGSNIIKIDSKSTVVEETNSVKINPYRRKDQPSRYCNATTHTITKILGENERIYTSIAIRLVYSNRHTINQDYPNKQHFIDEDAEFLMI